jgi:hypothetical protein
MWQQVLIGYYKIKYTTWWNHKALLNHSKSSKQLSYKLFIHISNTNFIEKLYASLYNHDKIASMINAKHLQQNQ